LVDGALQSPDPAAAFDALASQAGLSGTELPTEFAMINEILDSLPSHLCNQFLINFFNDLYV
jgi:hypothetical protein